jgi:hypothetical protein
VKDIDPRDEFRLAMCHWAHVSAHLLHLRAAGLPCPDEELKETAFLEIALTAAARCDVAPSRSVLATAIESAVFKKSSE